MPYKCIEKKNLRHTIYTKSDRAIEQSKRSGASKSKPILARKADEEWKEFSSIRAAADGLKVPMANISRTFNPDSKRHRAGGYEFKLKEIPDLEGEVWMDIEDEWLNEL